jgi:hypothetical protein
MNSRGNNKPGLIRPGRLHRFRRLPGTEKMVLMEALFFDLIAGLLLKIIPFRRIPSLFRNRGAAGAILQAGEIETIKTALGRAGRLSPWKNRCLVSSLAGRCMLNRRNTVSQISLGVTSLPGGRIIAHAWLRTEGFEVVEKNGEFTELYLF